MACTAAQAIQDGLFISNCHSYPAFAQDDLLGAIGLTIPVYMNILIGDAVVFWRAFVLWRPKHRMIFVPGVLLACTAVGVIVSSSLSISRISAQVPVTTIYYITFGLSVATNIATNVSMGYYTWLHRKAVRGYLDTGNHRARHEKILVLILESGTIYTGILIVVGVMIFVGDRFRDANFVWALMNAIIDGLGLSFVSIYPTLLIVVVFLRKSVWDAAGHAVNTRAIYLNRGGEV